MRYFRRGQPERESQGVPREPRDPCGRVDGRSKDARNLPSSGKKSAREAVGWGVARGRDISGPAPTDWTFRGINCLANLVSVWSGWGGRGAHLRMRIGLRRDAEGTVVAAFQAAGRFTRDPSPMGWAEESRPYRPGFGSGRSSCRCAPYRFGRRCNIDILPGTRL